MPPTKSQVIVLANDVVLGPGGDTHTSAAYPVLESYEATLYLKHTNGATPPTTAAASQVQESPDGEHWYNLGGPLSGQLGISGTYSWTQRFGLDSRYFRVVTTPPASQAITLREEATQVTGVQ